MSRNDNGTFKKGFSGNPKGKPKGTKSPTTQLRRILEETTGDISNMEIVCRNVINLAFEGKQWAIELIFNRLDGRPNLAEEKDQSILPSGFIIKQYAKWELDELDSDNRDVYLEWKEQRQRSKKLNEDGMLENDNGKAYQIEDIQFENHK